MRYTITLTGIFDEPTRNEDGSWSFDITARELMPHEVKVLDTLFPDLESAVSKLLAKQTVLNAVK